VQRGLSGGTCTDNLTGPKVSDPFSKVWAEIGDPGQGIGVIDHASADAQRNVRHHGLREDPRHSLGRDDHMNA
jgi:hypothetical protein